MGRVIRAQRKGAPGAVFQVPFVIALAKKRCEGQGGGGSKDVEGARAAL
jgi:hypothetical protein